MQVQNIPLEMFFVSPSVTALKVWKPVFVLKFTPELNNDKIMKIEYRNSNSPFTALRIASQSILYAIYFAYIAIFILSSFSFCIDIQTLILFITLFQL